MGEWLSDPVNVVLVGTVVSTLSSIASSQLPSDHWAVQLLDMFAFNVGKAKNDPGKQRKAPPEDAASD